MRSLTYEKRKRNGIITSILISIVGILIAALYIMLAFSPLETQIKIPLILISSIFIVIVFPKILFRFQFIIYNYLNKNIDMIESYLSSDFKHIYLKNTRCLKKAAIPLHLQRAYKAKLESDGTITIRIETIFKDEVFEEQTTDYSWFLSLFTFKE